ncbi:hypothetical protein RFI_14790, partial [Reticulomyxa filosa]
MIDGNTLVCDTLFKVSNVSRDCDLWLKGYVVSFNMPNLFKSPTERSDVGLSIVLRPDENEQFLAENKIPIIPPESVAHFICSNCDGGFLIFELYDGIDVRQSCNTTKANSEPTPVTSNANNRVNSLTQYHANRIMEAQSSTHKIRSDSFWTEFISSSNSSSSPTQTKTQRLSSTASELHINTMFEPLWLDLIIGWKYDPVSKKNALFALFHEFRTIQEYKKEINQWE